MTVPDYQTLMLPVLSASSDGEVRIGEVVESIAGQFQLSQEDRSRLIPSGTQTQISNRVHWAKSYLGKAGLIEITRRGYFRITDRGKKVLAEMPARIDNSFLNQLDEFRQFKEKSGQSSGADKLPIEPVIANQSETPDEIMRVAHGQVEASLAQDLLDRIRAAPADFFERLIVSLLLSMGYGGSAADAGRALGRSGDEGVDGVIDQDALGLDLRDSRN